MSPAKNPLEKYWNADRVWEDDLRRERSFAVSVNNKNFSGYFDVETGQGGVSFDGASFTHVNDWKFLDIPVEVNIKYVHIKNSTFMDLEGLGRFPALENLQISSSRVGSMAGIEACTGLKDIKILGCHLDSMAWVAPLDNIETLDLTRNDITRIEGVAGKQRLQKLFLGENKIASTAGLEDLPAITGVSIAKNDIRDVPNPDAMLAIIGPCMRAWRSGPGNGGFGDGGNPIHEIVRRESNDPNRPIYITLHNKERLAAMVPDLRRRLDAGEAVGMAFFKQALHIEDAYLAWYGDDAITRRMIDTEYTGVFFIARLAGLAVNDDAGRKDADAYVMRPVAGSDIEDFITRLRLAFC